MALSSCVDGYSANLPWQRSSCTRILSKQIVLYCFFMAQTQMDWRGVCGFSLFELVLPSQTGW